MVYIVKCMVCFVILSVVSLVEKAGNLLCRINLYLQKLLICHGFGIKYNAVKVYMYVDMAGEFRFNLLVYFGVFRWWLKRDDEPLLIIKWLQILDYERWIGQGTIK